MCEIKVVEIAPFALAEEDGLKVYDKIVAAIAKNKKVVVDFEKINLFATPFFNAAFGKFILNNNIEKFENEIKIINLNELGQETLNHSKENALLILKNKLSTETVGEIVKDNIIGE